MCLKKELLDALLMIQTRGPVDKGYGICHSVFLYWCQIHDKSANDEESWEVQDQLDKLLARVMQEWPQHSGNCCYPIADPSGKLEPSILFWQSRDKWKPKSPQGKLRLDLLTFCITQLQAQLRG